MVHRKTLFVMAVLALAAGSAALAQGEGVTWLGFSKVNSGMVEEAVALELENREFYDGLAAQGVIGGWGLATRVTHLPGDAANFVHFVALPSWANVGKWAEAFSQVLRGRSADERDAAQAAAERVYAPDSHFDVVGDDVFWSGTGEARPRYVYVGEFFAHPGKEAELTGIYRELVPPIGQKLIAEGLVTAFGLHTPSLHTGDGWTHTSYLFLTSLAAIDRYHEEVGKALTPELAARLAGIHDAERHRDGVWMLLHFGGAGDSGGQE